VVLQRWFERQLARWKHSRVVNRLIEKSAKRSGWHKERSQKSVVSSQ
jgi:hypothetical protein